MMRVFLASHSPTLVGGSERSLLEIASRLHREPDVRVRVAVPRDGALRNALVHLGIDVVVLPYDWAVNTPDERAVRASIAAMPAILASVDDFAPDVVVTNTSVIPWFAFAARQRGLPHAWFVREDASADINIDYYPSKADALTTIGACSDRIIVNSRYMAGVYARLLGRSDVEVVYPSFDRHMFEGVSPAPRDHVFSVIVPGVIVPAKNQLEMLEAVRVLRLQGRTLRVTIMGGLGSESYRESLRTYVREHELDDVVVFLDHQPRPLPIVAAHDVCVVPSRAEPFGRVTVEATLLSVPVVASDAGASPEILGTGGEVGILYPLGDHGALATAIGSLMDDPAKRRALGQAARAHARRHFVDRDPLDPLMASLTALARRPQAVTTGWERSLPAAWRSVLADGGKSASDARASRRGWFERLFGR